MEEIIVENRVDKTVTYYVGNKDGEIKSNLPIGPNVKLSKNAVTWGVFPLKEVVQPTVIDYESFKAWNEEAFCCGSNGPDATRKIPSRLNC